MKHFQILTMAMTMFLAGLAQAAIPSAVGSYASRVPYSQVVYVCGTTVGKGDKSGRNAADCLPFADQDLWRIPANALVSKVYVVEDVAVTGTTDVDVGDDDDADGYVDGSLSLSLGTPGLYSWNAKVAGAYLRVQTAGATDPADIYVVPNAKYYSAAGKEVKMDVTGINTAGALRVVIEGFMLGANSSTL